MLSTITVSKFTMKLREESIKAHRHLDKHKPFLNIWNIRWSTDRSILYFNVCSWNPFCKISLTSANFKAVGKTDWVIQSFRFEKTKPDKKSSNTFILMLARSRKILFGNYRFCEDYSLFFGFLLREIVNTPWSLIISLWN